MSIFEHYGCIINYVSGLNFRMLKSVNLGTVIGHVQGKQYEFESYQNKTVRENDQHS